jgi:hypothetical protein
MQIHRTAGFVGHAMISRAILVCAFLVADAVQAFAQPTPDLATDQELFAAYCLGVLQELAKEWEREPTGFPDIDIQLKRETKAATDSVQSYLRARGFVA